MIRWRPIWCPWLDELSRHFTLIRYDQRGCGLSDWDVADISLDAWVSDAEAVVHAAQLVRFSVLGLSQGGAIATAYAARHPDRMKRLVLCSSYAQGRLVRDPTPERREAVDVMLKLLELGWGTGAPAFRQVFTAMFIPEATAEQQRAFDELQVESTSPENAVRIMKVFNAIDVCTDAAAIRCPTLVLHSRRRRHFIRDGPLGGYTHSRRALRPAREREPRAPQYRARVARAYARDRRLRARGAR